MGLGSRGEQNVRAEAHNDKRVMTLGFGFRVQTCQPWRPSLKEGLSRIFESKRITRKGSSALGLGANVTVDSKVGSELVAAFWWWYTTLGVAVQRV